MPTQISDASSQLHSPSSKGDQMEGPVARTIEKQTSKLPSDLFLWAAGASIIASAVLQMRGEKKASLFVGQWVSPILLLGVYNKIVKVAGHDRAAAAHQSAAPRGLGRKSHEHDRPSNDQIAR